MPFFFKVLSKQIFFSKFTTVLSFVNSSVKEFNLLILSHLLKAGCDIEVQISVRPFVRQHLHRSFVFSASVKLRG